MYLNKYSSIHKTSCGAKLKRLRKGCP